MYRVEKFPIDNVRKMEEKLNKLESEGFRLVPGTMMKEVTSCVGVLYREGEEEPKKAERERKKEKNKEPKKEAEIKEVDIKEVEIEEIDPAEWDTYVA